MWEIPTLYSSNVNGAKLCLKVLNYHNKETQLNTALQKYLYLS